MRISPTWECLEYIVTVVWYDSKEDTFEKVIEKKLYFGKGYMKLRVPFGVKIYTTERKKKPEKTGCYDDNVIEKENSWILHIIFFWLHENY